MTDPDTGDTVRLVLYDPAAAAWRRQAACADPATAERLGITPTELLDLFFPVDEHDRRVARDTVIPICRTCPVRADCLDYALDRNIPDGIFGGFDEHERRQMRRRNKRARNSAALARVANTHRQEHHP